MNRINNYQTQKQQILKEAKQQHYLSLTMIMLASCLVIASFWYSDIIACIGFTLTWVITLALIYLNKKWVAISLKDLASKKGEPTAFIKQQPLWQRNKTAFQLLLAQLWLGIGFALIMAVLVITVKQTSDPILMGLIVVAGLAITTLLVISSWGIYKLITYKRKEKINERQSISYKCEFTEDKKRRENE